MMAVSYTHLRAHETYVLCRLDVLAEDYRTLAVFQRKGDYFQGFFDFVVGTGVFNVLQAGDELLEAGFVGTGYCFVGFGNNVVGI